VTAVAPAHALVVVLMLTVSHGVYLTTPQFAASVTRRFFSSPYAGTNAGHEKPIDPANEWHRGLPHARQQATIVAIDPDILSGRGPAAA